MTSDFAAFHDELRAVARGILGPSSPLASAGGPPRPLDWRLLASSGWLGLEIPEHLEGAGATFSEVAVILGEMGRAAACGPYLGSTVLGAGALNLLQAGDERDGLLLRAGSGEERLAVSLATGEDIGASFSPYRLEHSGGRLSLHGEATFVPDATDADRLLLLAESPDGPVVVAAAPGDSGLRVSEQAVIDGTRRLATVAADGMEVREASVWRFASGPREAASGLFDRGALAVACDSLGVAEAMLDATVTYASARRQFDRPIGSFQAVKHACADMLVKVAVSRELVVAAADAVAAGVDDAWVAVSQAKSYACETGVEVAGKAMQLHGGIGYTWESGIHRYLKRAVLNRSLFGSPSAHRKRLAARLA